MGTVKDEVYKCDVCGNVALILKEGDGKLVCCGQDMRLLKLDETQAFLKRMGRPGSP